MTQVKKVQEQRVWKVIKTEVKEKICQIETNEKDNDDDIIEEKSGIKEKSVRNENMIQEIKKFRK